MAPEHACNMKQISNFGGSNFQSVSSIFLHQEPLSNASKELRQDLWLSSKERREITFSFEAAKALNKEEESSVLNFKTGPLWKINQANKKHTRDCLFGKNG